MGLARMGPPQELALLLRDQASIDTFVETGTYQGGTTAWAAQHFQRVVTIERAPAFHEAARLRFAPQKHVTCLFGHSRDGLASVTPTLPKPSLFWLDAHWSGGVTYGDDDECPLLDEIAVIDQDDRQHVLLIDDARLFLAPPPAPHRPESWPTIDSVCRVLMSRGDSYLCVHDDVIIRVPSHLRSVVVEYCRQSSDRLAPSGRGRVVRRPRFLSWVRSLLT